MIAGLVTIGHEIAGQIERCGPSEIFVPLAAFTDADDGGENGVGGCEQARREHPGASVDGCAFRNTERSYLREGETAATR